MKLVRLSGDIAVNPCEVASVTLPDRKEYILVTMRSGDVHYIDPDYGGTRWKKYDEILRALEAAE